MGYRSQQRGATACTILAPMMITATTEAGCLDSPPKLNLLPQGARGNITLQLCTLSKMAPNLLQLQHVQIQHMIEDGGFTYRQIGEVANCSFDAVKAISRNLRDFGSTTAPRTNVGRPPSITPVIRDTLLEHLLRKPD